MSLARSAAAALLPVGSSRRARVLGGLRVLGWTSRANDYQRWIRAVEPWLFHNERASADHPVPVRFEITIEVPAGSSPADLDRTVLSLQAQWIDRWSAEVRVDEGVAPRTLSHIDHLRACEHRLGTSGGADEAGRTSLRVVLRAGDVLAPRAFNEVLLALGDLRDPIAIVANADRLNAGAASRAGLLQVHSISPDAAAQFDVLAAFVVFVGDADAASVRAELLRGKRHRVGQIGLVLVHRAPASAPSLILPPADVPTVRHELGLLEAGVSVDSGGPWFGTRVRRSTHAPVCVIVANRLPGGIGERQRSELAAMAASGGGMVVFAEGVDTATAGELALRVEATGAAVTVVVDGSLRVVEASFALDLAGSALRSGVAAVAPIIRAPSGMVVDAGLMYTGEGTSLRARCGRIERPPHDLCWCCDVDALSGRMLAVRTADLARLGDVPLGPEATRELADVTGGRLVICAHQQAVVAFGIENLGGVVPGLAAWHHGRLARWFGEGITGYRPRTSNEEESVW